MPELSVDGFEVLPRILTAAQCEAIAAEIESVMQETHDAAISSPSADSSRPTATVGGRNLQQNWSGWRAIVDLPEIQQYLRTELGDEAGLVRMLFFDKPPGHGWALAQHRDQTIAVDRHHEPPSPFSHPTTKAGVPHVRATDTLLESMLTLRFHLDPMHQGNGPLVVTPGSHCDREGSADHSTNAKNHLSIHTAAGDVFVMRPLLMHGSLPCESDCIDHRRVLHMEFSPTQLLPAPYRWFRFDAIRVSRPHRE